MIGIALVSVLSYPSHHPSNHHHHHHSCLVLLMPWIPNLPTATLPNLPHPILPCSLMHKWVCLAQGAKLQGAGERETISSSTGRVIQHSLLFLFVNINCRDQVSQGSSVVLVTVNASSSTRQRLTSTQMARKLTTAGCWWTWSVPGQLKGGCRDVLGKSGQGQRKDPLDACPWGDVVDCCSFPHADVCCLQVGDSVAPGEVGQMSTSNTRAVRMTGGGEVAGMKSASLYPLVNLMPFPNSDRDRDRSDRERDRERRHSRSREREREPRERRRRSRSRDRKRRRSRSRERGGMPEEGDEREKRRHRSRSRDRKRRSKSRERKHRRDRDRERRERGPGEEGEEGIKIKQEPEDDYPDYGSTYYNNYPMKEEDERLAKNGTKYEEEEEEPHNEIDY
ncbi:hypothetical protein E2C01_043755 [Portunus trituberculatus]|uniref:Uncharacterized protein n=1 Tax=Portunus trituberculatus TaxID=210409 RepID=A0A5B7FQA7_PORTR|nr:hypothetical protein [Portunus trituberculatus]